MLQVVSDTLYLLTCALNEEKAEAARINAMDLDALYAFCKEHSITALVASVLTAFIKNQPQQYDKWSQEQMKAVYRDINFAVERADILSFMEKNGIWYMPLKGVILKELYPNPSLREFADNDILFDEAFAEQVKDYMVAKGYSIKNYNKGHVDEYQKEPCYNFEMHKYLYYYKSPVYFEYYKDVKKRLKKDNNNQFGYHFSDEDFYIYIISHIYYHYCLGGTGLRALLDVYVFNEAKAAGADWDYIEQELTKIGCEPFEKNLRSLANKVISFSPAVLSEEENQTWNCLLLSGTYGTVDRKIQNRMKELTGKSDVSRSARIKYWFKRTFDMSIYKKYYPFAYKTKVLIPFVAVFRMLRGFTKLGKLKTENSVLKEIEQEQNEKDE